VLIPVRLATMRPHAWFMDVIGLRAYRHTIETVNSQLEKMGIERLYARTNAGFELKVHATLIALICTNMNEQSRYPLSRNIRARSGIWASEGSACLALLSVGNRIAIAT